MLIATKFFSSHRRLTFRWFRPLPLPIPTRIILKRFLSTRHDDDATARARELRIDRDRINLLLSSIDEFVTNGQNQTLVQGYVHKKLSEEQLMNPSRHVAFEKVISLLMARRYFTEAAAVYQRMLNEGFIPSSSTNAQMLAVTLAVSSDSEDQLMAALDDIFADPKYTESRLRELLDLIADLDFSAQTSLTIAQRFVDSRGSHYTPSKLLLTKLVGIQARAGLMDDALDNLVRSEFGDDTEASSVASSYPYVAILTSIKDTQPRNTQAINMVLKHMEESGVHPNVSVFNALIAREVRQRSLYRAFALYDVLMHLSKTMPLSPDAFTFGSLFSILTKLYRPSVRTARTRHYKRPDNVTPPRQLFRDMISCHLNRSRVPPSNGSLSGVITQSILNVALRTFLSKGDYVGAFVVVRAFSTFHLKVTAKTYYIVMRHVMNRIRWDIKGTRRVGESRWADRMLGLKPQPDVWQLKVDEAMAEKVLRFGDRPGFDILDDPDSAHRNISPKYVTPTLAMMDGEEPVPPGIALDSVPLERILRRAILADTPLHPNTIVHPVSDDKDTPARRVSRVIAEGKDEMIPKEAKQKRDQRRHRSKNYTK